MGLIKNPHRDNEYSKPEDYFETNAGKFGHWEIPKYDISWDWLMSVVAKIDSIHDANFKYDIEQIRAGNWPKDDQFTDVIAMPLNTPISEACEEIVKFINWFNQQSSLKNSDDASASENSNDEPPPRKS